MERKLPGKEQSLVWNTDLLLFVLNLFSKINSNEQSISSVLFGWYFWISVEYNKVDS